jgi:WD40 repeat protein
MPRHACLTSEELTAFHLGDLPVPALEEMAAHLEGCPRCEAAARALDNLTDSVVAAYRQSARSSQFSAPAVPPTIGEYEIVEEIGRGGMGVVYKARHRKQQRVVALKMLLGGAFTDREERARFRAEAAAVARLHHPNIVQIYEIGEHDVGDGLSRPYFTLAFAGGGNLAGRIAGRPQPPRQAAGWLEALARAAHYAHQQGIVHRSLKPSNVLLDPSGEPKICDFGVAKLLTGSDVKTRSGTLLGTAEYMAPEQVSGQAAVGPPADVYALGAILYTALTGRPPFQGTSSLHTLEQVRSREPVPPQRLQPHVPRDLDTICLKCLEKDPARRYASAQALADDLLLFLEDRPIEARPVRTLERAAKWVRRRPAVAGLVAALVLLAAVGSALVVGLWLKAEARAESEARATTDAREKGQAAEDARRENDRLLTSVVLDHAVNLCERGDVDVGLLNLANGLRKAAQLPDPDLERVARVNLVAWRPHLITLRGELHHAGWAWAVAFSPDSHTVATGGSDGVAQLWDAHTGKALTGPLRHAYPVYALAFSPDGKTLLTGSGDDKLGKGESRLWNAVTGEPLVPPLPQADQVNRVTFSPDGKCFLTVCQKEARVWQTAADPPMSIALPHPPPATKRALVQPRLWAVFSPDGTTVLTGGEDGTARQWDAATGGLRGEPLRHDGPVLALAYSPDGKTILTGCYYGTARLWDAATGMPRSPELRHLGQVQAVAFSSDGRLIATAGGVYDEDAAGQSRLGVVGEVRLWRAATGERVGAAMQQPQPVWAIAFRPGDRMLLTGARDRTARFYSVPDGMPLGKALDHEGTVANVAFSPDGSLAVTASAGGNHSANARLWELPAQADGPPPPFPGRFGEIRRRLLCFLPECREVLTGYVRKEDAVYESTAQVFDLQTGRPAGPKLRHAEDVRRGSCGPDGRLLLTVAGSNLVQSWDRTTGQLQSQYRPEGGVEGEVWSADGRTVALFCADRTVRLWDAITGKTTDAVLRLEGTLSAMLLYPDGHTLLTLEDHRQLRQWDGRTGDVVDAWTPRFRFSHIAFRKGEPVALTGERGHLGQVCDLHSGRALTQPLTGVTGVVQGLAFAPDGRTLLTGSWERRLARLWDVATGKPIGPTIVHEDAVRLVAFSADGRIMLSGSMDGRVHRSLVPVPLAGDVARLQCWIEVLTGLELTAQGSVHHLEPEDLRRRRERLRQLGGPP